ncbi:MAG: lipid-binding protein [Flavobacteriales bacterium]|nr:lipid-binding protein [Flavobacteriales bacterium]
MKKIAFIIALTIGFSSFTSAHTDHFKIDIQKSNVKWVGSKISGSSHEGNISITEGIISINDGNMVNAEFVVDLNTMTCTDLGEKKAGYLVDHLKNEDFFDVPNHPQARLKLIKATKTEKGYNIIAGLTIKDKTHPVVFDIEWTQRGVTALASGTLTFNRTKFDITYGSGSFFDDLGDRAIKDEVILEFRVMANHEENGAHH